MSPPGRPKGEYCSAQHEGTSVTPPGRMGHEGAPPGPLANTAVRSTKARQ